MADLTFPRQTSIVLVSWYELLIKRAIRPNRIGFLIGLLVLIRYSWRLKALEFLFSAVPIGAQVSLWKVRISGGPATLPLSDA